MADNAISVQPVNETRDDPNGRPMLYDPVHGCRIGRGAQYLATIIVCLSAAAAGTGLAWTSPVSSQLTSNTSSVPTTEAESTWVASYLPIGALFGALASGIVAEKIGRKYSAIVIDVIFTIGYLITVFASKVLMLYVARVLIGIATGAACVVAPVYISEYAEASIRGTLGTCFQLFLTIGILLIYVVGAITNWIILSWICLSLPILGIVGLLFIPESPVWLLKNGRQNDAAYAIKWFWGVHCNVNVAIQGLQNDLDSSGGSGGISELFSVRANRNGFLLSMFLMFCQQFSGINAVIFFTKTIFEAAGSTLDSNVSSIIVGIVQVLMTFAAAILVERAGRKILLLQSSFVMGLCLTMLGAYFYLKENKHSIVPSIGWIPLVSLVLFIVSFSLGYGPIPWMMMGELLPPDVKSVATSLVVLFNWTLVFIVTKSFDFLLKNYGGSITFWLFGIIMAVGTVLGLKLIFETKGKSNAEIQSILAGGK